MTVSEYFKKNLSNWFGKTDTLDCITYVYHKQMGNMWHNQLRQNFHIPLDEEILFSRDTSFWSNRNEGLVITDKTLYFLPDKNDPSGLFNLQWIDIKAIQYKESFLYFYAYGEDDPAFAGANFFFKGVSSYELENGLGNKLAAHLTQMAELAGERANSYEKAQALEEEEKYDEAIAVLDELIKDPTYESNPYLHFYKARNLVKKEHQLEDVDEGRIRLIEKEFNKAEELSDDENLTSYCNYWKAYLYSNIGQDYKSRNYFILAMDSDSEEMRDDAVQGLAVKEEALKDLWEQYTSFYEYKDRKFIMPINDGDIAGCVVDGIDTFRMSNIPSCIKFPTGHPVANELYIGHPYNPSVYVPYSESEDIFFMDKIDELTYLLQCLGAEEITITSIKGKNVSEYEAQSSQLSAHLDTGISDMTGSTKNNFTRNQSFDSRQEHTLHIKCDPMKYPYVPDGLAWYGNQPRWQRLVEGRLNGNRLEYSEFISSTDTRFVSNTEKKDIKLAAERLWVKVKGNAKSIVESQFKEHAETQWKVDVVFRSLRAFSAPQITDNLAMQLNDSEQEYLEMYEEYAADGEISERDRRMLDKFRNRLGISEQRAHELEETYSKPKLTEDEQEYLDMYKEYIAEGDISERDRKMLNKMRDRMGIEEERAKEIEQLIR